MDFAKLHGLGNDFIVANAGEAGGEQASLSALAKNLCDRHCGVGADGAVFYQPTLADREADFSALIFNADGSRAEMSGNGVRCLAAFLTYSGQHHSPIVRIRTVSGVKQCTLEGSDGLVYWFRCSMGVPIIDPARIPVTFGTPPGPVLDYPLPVGTETVRVSVCSMGNPHCSTFWPDIDEAPFQEYGTLLESHPGFPKHTNVEFIQVLDSHRMRVRFWERGVGPTLCSGTGSSAAVVASILKGSARSPIQVLTEMGRLDVEWEPGKVLHLTGPAELVCTGTFSPEVRPAQP
jgi:diaminopimelate epimerase